MGRNLTADVYPEDAAAFPEIKQKLAVIRMLRTGRASKDATMGDVFHKGIEAYEAEIAALWTPEHEAALRAGKTSRAAQAAVSVAAAKAEGLGPDTPYDQKIAVAVGLHDEGVPDVQIAELFGAKRQAVVQWRQRAAKDATETAWAAEARRLFAEEGVPVRQVAERLGVSWQKAARWCHNAPAAPPDRKTRARSRSAGSGAVKHATPVTFLAPEAKP